MLSNPLYADAFAYIGAFVKEREKLIEDGYPEEYVDGKKKGGEMTEQCKRLRAEQADMVMILLNLAYIPDEVVHKINFRPGWSREFKRNMDEYKAKFARETGRKWEFQNKRLEDDYMDYVHAAEENDTDAIKEKTVDKIDDKFKDFFKSVAAHRKGLADAPAAGGSVNLDQLKALNLGGKKTTIN